MKAYSNDMNSTNDTLNNIKFSDIFKLADIQHMQDMFADATGIASVITDTEGRPMTNPSNFCRLCSDIIRNTEKGRANCYHSDSVIGRHNPSGPIIQSCLSGGFWDAGASITIGGKHIANWLIGQVRTEEFDQKRMIEYAVEIGADKEEFLEALNEVPFMPLEQFKKVAKMLFAFASELSEKAFSNLQLKQQIAENEKAYEQIEKSEELYKSILNASPDNITITDMEGRALIASQSAFNMYGYQEDEVLGKIVTDFIAPDFRQQAKSDISLMLRGTSTGPKEYQGERKDGSTFDMEVKGEYIRDANDQPTKAIFITHDITERKRNEELLKASETKYRLITEKIRDVVWLMDLNGKSLFVSQSIEKFTGYTVDEYLAQSIFDRFTPESATFAYETLKKEVRLYSNPEGPPKDYQKTLIFEYRCKDGNTKTGEVIITPYFDEKNTLIGLHGVTRDITERKQAEDVLKNSEKEYRLLFMNNPTPMWVYDINSLAFLAVNDFAVDHYGYSRKEFLNITIKDIRTKDDIPYLNEVLQRDSGSLRKVKGVRHRRKDGSLIDVEITAHEIAFEGHSSMFVNALDVTERKLAEENLHHSEAKYRELVENLNDVVYSIGSDSIIHYVTPSVKMMGGYEPSELIGTSLFKLVHPDDLNLIRSAFAEVISGQTSPREYRILTKNGSVKWVRSSSRPVLNGEQIIGLQGVISDITELKRSEVALRENEQQYRLLAENITDVIWVLDPDTMHFLYVSPSIEQLLGFTPGELMTLHFSEILVPEIREPFLNRTRQRVESFLKQIEPGIGYRNEVLHLRKDGSQVWTEVTNRYYLNETTGRVEIQGVSRDITERKQVENELIKAKEHAEESDRLKSSFLANMSHEIRTPMNGILGFAELLKDPDLSGEQQEHFIGIIERSGARMLNIINDIIDISKIEAGQMNVSISETNINGQLEYLNNFFKPEAEQKGIGLSIKNFLPASEAIINTDRDKLYSILANLVKNALKFTKTGYIEVGYSLKVGAVVEPIEPAELEFYVRDTGIGIRPDQKEFIFDRFRQGHETLNKNYEGAGLGLAISKAFVEMLGGKIRVESEPENLTDGSHAHRNNKTGGSVFYFTIPYNTATKVKNTGENIIKVKDEETQINPEVSGLKILIAEDDESSVKYLAAVVKKISKEVLKVRTGIEAIEACRNNPDIDLVLMDIQMPEMDGYEATRQIRQFNSDLVIIAQTAFALEGDKEKAIAAGCNDYVSKPIKRNELMELMKKFFKK